MKKDQTEKLNNERFYLRNLKQRLTNRIKNKSCAGLKQLFKRLDKYNFELKRINGLLKDYDNSWGEGQKGYLG